MAENERANKAPPPVAGYFNGLFTRDMDGAMAAVIVAPQASHSQRLAWALGQLYLLKTVAEVASRGEDDGAAIPLAHATRQLLEQSMAVLEGILDEMERPPEVQPQPLRVV